MENLQTVGLIGYGHLGHAVAEQIVKRAEVRLVIADDRSKNIEVATQSDVLILTVRPTQIFEVMNEVRRLLKANVVVLSFAAAVPNNFIANGRVSGSEIQVVRAMTDIGLGQIIAQDNFATNGLLEKISAHPLLKAETEKDIDAFSVLAGCLPGVSAWQFAHNPKAAEWLHDYVEFIHAKLGVAIEVCKIITEDVRLKGNFEQTINTVATKGGITESLIQELQKRPGISFQELFDTGMDRIDAVKNQVIGRPDPQVKPIPW
jgi:pyrroline-5-carboxylate reductase